uniref:Pectinesterase n=1 Tax=Oryza punctata TaxID=4537 RepID=A0A0E0LP75_ORYPU
MQPSRHHLLLLPLLLLLLLLGVFIATSSAAAPVSKTITVDQQGGGDFRLVQSAVNFVPDGNSEWIKIHVKAGSYKEKVTIPSQKPFILLEGDGSWNTEITFAGHAHASIDELLNHGFRDVGGSPTFYSSTFIVLADNFIARNIAFKNTYNKYDKSKPNQAVAALIGGDRSAFYDCAFYGFQDTLCDLMGRHYFHNCYIKGGVDFIFGYGQSIYDNCTLESNMPSSTPQQPGWVTAHARLTATNPGGLVFKGGSLHGSGQQYLGRAWNQFATVFFYQMSMTDIVVPQGWQPWYSPNVSTITFAEVGCEGPGANKTGRVAWEKQLDDDQVHRFVDISFIDDGWLSQQPQL